MIVLVKTYPKIMLSTDLMKINRSISYMSFFIKDIFEYANAKGPDDTNLSLVRNAENEIIKCKEMQEKLIFVMDENEVE